MDTILGDLVPATMAPIMRNRGLKSILRRLKTIEKQCRDDPSNFKTYLDQLQYLPGVKDTRRLAKNPATEWWPDVLYEAARNIESVEVISMNDPDRGWTCCALDADGAAVAFIKVFPPEASENFHREKAAYINLHTAYKTELPGCFPRALGARTIDKEVAAAFSTYPYPLSEISEGYGIIWMDFIEGETLDANSMDAEDAIGAFCALFALHWAGILAIDINLANFIKRKDSKAICLCDFDMSDFADRMQEGLQVNAELQELYECIMGVP